MSRAKFQNNFPFTVTHRATRIVVYGGEVNSLIGTVPWNGKVVPLVSFEGACGQMIPPASGRTRIVILHALGTRVEGGNFALISQGFPQLVRVSSDVVRPDNSRVFPERTPIICQIRMVNETPLVPDLERLEEMIAEETSISA